MLKVECIMINERKKIMKTTLRYLLSMVMVLSVLSVSAQTPQYGKTYNPNGSVYTTEKVFAQMPVATMGSTSSELVSSGSTLPQAAATGVTTTSDMEQSGSTNGRMGQIRRERPGDNKDPYEDPIGDAMIPLMLLACAYLIVRATRRRALSRSANGSQGPNHSANW